MSCSPFDLKDYFLQELADSERRQVEAHVKTCEPCRVELDRLGFTEAALLSVREEEIPQRIAFVSDKIFEPSPLRRWLGGFWGSAARLGFASAAMLSAAICFYAIRPPATVQIVERPVAAQTMSASDIQAKIDAAVAQVEERESAKTKKLVADLAEERQKLEWAIGYVELQSRKFKTLQASNAGYALPPDHNAPKDQIQ